MWFVIHVKPGCESQAVELLKSTSTSDGLEEVFCPMAQRVHRERGVAVEKRDPMLEGCVFAVAPGKRELRACMRRAEGMSSLYDRNSVFDAMQPGEEDFINVLAAPGNRVVRMSEGIVDDGQVVVQDGPLRGRERDIHRFSGRNRWAYLDTSVAGKPVSARVGLRVTRGARA